VAVGQHREGNGAIDPGRLGDRDQGVDTLLADHVLVDVDDLAVISGSAQTGGSASLSNGMSPVTGISGRRSSGGRSQPARQATVNANASALSFECISDPSRPAC
jgi:hypothetical protein